MAMKALLEGSAGKYQIRGAIWELGSFTYRAYLHLVPTGQRPNPPGRSYRPPARACKKYSARRRSK